MNTLTRKTDSAAASLILEFDKAHRIARLRAKRDSTLDPCFAATLDGYVPQDRAYFAYLNGYRIASRDIRAKR